MNDLFGRSVDRRSWLTRIDSAGYLVGSIVGGAVAGATLGFLASWTSQLDRVPYLISHVAAFAIAAAGIALELVGRFTPLPQRKAQVPTSWLHWRSRPLTGVAYGFTISSGVFVYLHHAAIYVVAACVILSGKLWIGLVVGVSYGLAWGISPAAASLASDGWFWFKERSAVSVRRLLSVTAAAAVLTVILAEAHTS